MLFEQEDLICILWAPLYVNSILHGANINISRPGLVPRTRVKYTKSTLPASRMAGNIGPYEPVTGFALHKRKESSQNSGYF